MSVQYRIRGYTDGFVVDRKEGWFLGWRSLDYFFSISAAEEYITKLKKQGTDGVVVGEY